MPLFEFECRGCGDRFELLVRPGDTPGCPSCRSTEIVRLLSMFAVSSDATRALHLQGARKAGAKEQRDRKIAEAEAIRNHDH